MQQQIALRLLDVNTTIEFTVRLFLHALIEVPSNATRPDDGIRHYPTDEIDWEGDNRTSRVAPVR